MVEAEHEGETLKIDQVRELQHTLSLAPYEARYRIAILLRFEEAHASAANAMLKTLEEPPAQVVVILTAKSAESLLPTIVSRCEVLRLRPLVIRTKQPRFTNDKGMYRKNCLRSWHIFLMGVQVMPSGLFEQPGLLEQRQSWLDELIRLLAASRRERFAYAREIVDDKEGLRDELQVWLTFLA